MSFADHGKLKAKGRNFDCSKCDSSIRKLRRCEEDREDFTSKDSAIFPLKIFDHGSEFGFCPSKATWEPYLMDIFNILLITTKTGNLLISGGLENQPVWYIELLGEFILKYDNLNFIQKAEMVLGSDDKIKNMSAKQSSLKGARHGRN